jgi:ABC-type transporter Mla subunit MlaD
MKTRLSKIVIMLATGISAAAIPSLAGAQTAQQYQAVQPQYAGQPQYVIPQNQPVWTAQPPTTLSPNGTPYVVDPNSLDRANQSLSAAIAADQQANGSLQAAQQQVSQMGAQLSQEQQTFANLQATQNALLQQVNQGTANDRFRTAASLNNVTGAMQASQDRIGRLSADLGLAQQNLQARAAQAAQADQAVASAQQTRDQIAAEFAAAEGTPLYSVPPTSGPTVVYAQPPVQTVVVPQPLFTFGFGVGHGPVFVARDFDRDGNRGPVFVGRDDRGINRGPVFVAHDRDDYRDGGRR